MGRIIAPVLISSLSSPSSFIRCNALVDTSVPYLVLPTDWKDQLGELEVLRKVEIETATQQVVEGEICGPVKIQIEGFRPIYNEVVFLDMAPKNGIFEPWLGYIILEQSQAVVDMIGQRLIQMKRMDLK